MAGPDNHGTGRPPAVAVEGYRHPHRAPQPQYGRRLTLRLHPRGPISYASLPLRAEFLAQIQPVVGESCAARLPQSEFAPYVAA
jgi:hypothetical protein